MTVEAGQREVGQREVIDFLSSSAAFDGGGPVKRIDTHGAHVFLCGTTALKLKRAVRYDYMDLSTAELRHDMIMRELELNAPAAPSIYRCVQAVTRGPNGLQLDGDGPILDWVLSMNRFSAEDELEVIAERGELDGSLADAVGQMVWQYHSACPERTHDGASLLGTVLDELDRVFAEFDGADGVSDLAEWRVRSRQAFDAVHDLLNMRSRTGHVKRGHGDLHLRNIVMIEGRPTPFDALEFDETLGTCDVLYDLAFLLMDLDHCGLNEAATRALSQYLLVARGREDGGLAALPLFMSVRAAIRAMVLLQTDKAADHPGRSLDQVQAYLGQAVSALVPSQPRLVVIGGLSGSGKTTLARALAPGLGAAPGAVHLSTDAERKAAAGRPVDLYLPETAYDPQARGAVYEALLRRAETILGAGHGVVLDGTFLDPEQREQIAQLGKRADVPVSCLWLAAPAKVMEARVAARRKDASDANLDVLHHQLEANTVPTDWLIVDAGQNTDTTVAAARLALALDKG